MNIDFIKWMIGYADGFEIKQRLSGYIIVDPEKTQIDDDMIEEDKVVYPLLLQRAIEGINITERWLIMQGCNHIDVYDSMDELDEIVIEVPQDVDSIDQAKEQALKYIYEQEKD